MLDTLLRSAWLHPPQESRRREAIAERVVVAVTGRHSALGDALVTAAVFLRLVPPLHGRGVLTLGDARPASQQTDLARRVYRSRLGVCPGRRLCTLSFSHGGMRTKGCT